MSGTGGGRVKGQERREGEKQVKEGRGGKWEKGEWQEGREEWKNKEKER